VVPFSAGATDFSFETSRPSLRPSQLPTQLIKWTVSPAVKQSGRETDNSCPLSGQNDWIMPPIPMCLHNVYGAHSPITK